MLKEKTLGQTGVGDDKGGSRDVRLDRHEGEPGEEGFLRVRGAEITVRKADPETVDSEL